MERGGRGEGVMKGEGMVVLGRRCRPRALVIREWGVVIGRLRSPFVGGVVVSVGARCCSWGSRLWAPSCCLWAVGLVHVWYMFVSGGLLFVSGGSSSCKWAVMSSVGSRHSWVGGVVVHELEVLVVRERGGRCP
jgi:hypothetical protein